VSKEFSLVGRVVVDFSNLSDFSFVVSVFVGTKEAAEGFYAGELF
jgi:hypothetical protein